MYTVTTLLGKRDEPALTVCARHMAERLVQAGCSRWKSHPTCIPLMSREAPRHTLRIFIDEKAMDMFMRRFKQQGQVQTQMNNVHACRPLLLCLGLKEHTLNAMREIIKQVLEHPVWR
jgi:hypothetical protein